MTDPSSSNEIGSDNFVLPVSEAWRRWRQRVDLADYDQRWDRLEAQGQRVHDEADLVERVGGLRVLDAGCGTGRVATELARRNKLVVGVDSDADMLAYARRKPEPVRWEHADLATMNLLDRDPPQRFDTIVMAGNILLFVEPATRAEVLLNQARHLVAGGALIMGCTRSDDFSYVDVDRWCAEAGLELAENYATWDEQPFEDDGGYRVSVHRRTD